MKVSREQVAENRQRVLQAAARLFRERGFDGVSVADIMSAAGLTHGAFYGYFGSKDELVAATCAHVLQALRDDAELPSDLQTFAAAYLSSEHRDEPGGGCLYSTVGCEAARASPATRHELTGALRRRIESFAHTADGDTPAARRKAATGAWAAMVGAMMLARLVDDQTLSDRILSDTKAWLKVVA